MSSKTVVDESADYEKEIGDLEYELEVSERDRDYYEDQYEKYKKDYDQIVGFINENGLGSKLRAYMSEHND